MEEEIPGSTEQTPAEARGGKSFWYCTVLATFWNHLITSVICMCMSQLKRENARLLEALSVEKNSGSSLKKLQQQVVSLSSQLSQKDRLIKSLEDKVGYLLHNHKQWKKVSNNFMQLSEIVSLKVKFH